MQILRNLGRGGGYNNVIIKLIMSVVHRKGVVPGGVVGPLPREARKLFVAYVQNAI